MKKMQYVKNLWDVAKVILRLRQVAASACFRKEDLK